MTKGASGGAQNHDSISNTSSTMPIMDRIMIFMSSRRDLLNY